MCTPDAWRLTYSAFIMMWKPALRVFGPRFEAQSPSGHYQTLGTDCGVPRCQHWSSLLLATNAVICAPYGTCEVSLVTQLPICWQVHTSSFVSILLGKFRTLAIIISGQILLRIIEGPSWEIASASSSQLRQVIQQPHAKTSMHVGGTRSCPNDQSDTSTYSNGFRSFTRSMTRDEFRSALKRNQI